MQSSKLLNQGSKQHVKLSKTSLNKKKMQSIHDPKYAHTHTHETSLTNFIFQKQVKTI